MEIKTLKDLKNALKDIPDEVLKHFGAGASDDCGECVQLLCWSCEMIEDKDMDDLSDYYRTYAKKYPKLDDISKWIENIGKEQIKVEEQEDNSVYEREEPISSKEKN